jgi:hypothetical protein
MCWRTARPRSPSMLAATLDKVSAIGTSNTLSGPIVMSHGSVNGLTSRFLSYLFIWSMYNRHIFVKVVVKTGGKSFCPTTRVLVG